MTTTTTTTDKAAAVPDGLHHRRGVEYLAAASGLSPDKLGAAVVFGEDLGFSEATGFFKESIDRAGDPSPEGATRSFFRGGGRSPPTPSSIRAGSVISCIET